MLARLSITSRRCHPVDSGQGTLLTGYGTQCGDTPRDSRTALQTSAALKGIPVRYTTLGRSGASVSVHALGTMTFGSEADEATSGKILETYVEGGGNLIDTADVYTHGVSEEIIGRWLAAHPEDAEELVIATKGRFPTSDGPNGLGLSRRHLRTALDASLTRLGRDHIDLYQMHAWDALTPIEETLRFLDDSVTAGKIGYYGFSNFLGWQLTKAVHVAAASHFTPPVTLQPQYNLLVRGIEHEVVPAALDAGVGLLPWSPLAGGWLSGKYERDVSPSGPTRLGENPDRGMEAWSKRNADERTWRVVDAVANVATSHGARSSQVALAWLGAQPAVTSVILGARTVEQLTDNMGAVDLELTPDDLAALDTASAPAIDDYPYGGAGSAQRHRKITGGR
jgi:aryl-alcohol dehydrogenase-like predicted oxidoreductase